MKRTPGGPIPLDLDLRISGLIEELPPHQELSRLLANLDDPVSNDAGRDRSTGITAGNAVEGALGRLLATGDSAPPKKRMGFLARIRRARELGLITEEELHELDRIRRVRDAFAHALVPLSFGDPTITEVTDLFWDHPVSNWSE